MAPLPNRGIAIRQVAVDKGEPIRTDNIDVSRQDKVSLARRAERDGRVEDAERLYREAIRERDSYGYNNLAQLLIEVGRMRELERLFRKGVNAGDPLAAKNLAFFSS